MNYSTDSSPAAIVAGDFNGDSQTDLAVVVGTGVDILLGNGDGSFQAAVPYGAGINPVCLLVSNFNGDGKADLAVVNSGNGQSIGSLSILAGKGDGTFQTAANLTVGPLPVSVAAADFNGDGKADLVVSNSQSSQQNLGSVSVLIGDGDGTFQTVAVTIPS